MGAAAKTTRPDQGKQTLTKQYIDVFHLLHRFVDRTKVDESLMKMHDTGLSIPQMIALHALRHGGAHSMCQLAGKATLSRPAMSHLVDRLVSLDLVSREEDAKDRRHKQVSLSPKGVALIDQLAAAKTSRIEAGIEVLSAATRARLAGVLADMERELMARIEARPASENEDQ